MNTIFNDDLKSKLASSGVIAVITIEDAAQAVPLARLLVDEGITAMELTLRTPCALDALEAITKEVPEMNAGVGTVLKASQLDDIISRKALFAVAPGCNTKVIDAALERKFPFGPGITTASEIEAAVEKGCRVLKLFPAEPLGGVSYLKSLNSPYGFLDLKYIPLGGLNVKNMASWLERPEVLAIGGSWIAPNNMINNKDWSGIAANAREAARIVKEVRG
ncbi:MULTISPECIES: bifunctional 4-hydroxy-2-oxoglutarate aldolase/2-dehydro-3-deoxy-phosphogluconate aldolase [unclassified Oceanispirochaeta]|uniref:bifunctional 4-hydroxy-2-oxoglutarate aldolase/2-dehydro-3-deoxy-phosphogluconate aldolase n=1 Tax=unclassified Oceanispirochaeta TaxID=2635722 RepID=UPI000E0999F1|nr:MULTISPECIES: bifunctional 4-hydroxy-2-oxoglutarate aldolase/2-dehydro-3-deoxy-phosphogluconate aldolase [unclassified Oceanispirochaeta]MBF9014530.1 bifunctional 4-hydroxy-2-oxoglutarate aldolase/2-dehydro-3-deoxy-phosphogluconate aldolase [Oceanispirochaeta sp. M2]NPD70786.1 bifunctional 4-hydroxy-2-oxoglutarate aldolase/2-dehydro-3-deoxy-phosphogluconate aldolase [Oceanispirochaeta sp. M1]RDG34068.1 bifunctional 4-hydroxy-2-oxoglutarate aldolase/2-dehydro-3-deoxy-phosphogluconate aldolase 